MSGWWFNKVVPRPCHALTNVPASMLGRWGNEIFCLFHQYVVLLLLIDKRLSISENNFFFSIILGRRGFESLVLLIFFFVRFFFLPSCVNPSIVLFYSKSGMGIP